LGDSCVTVTIFCARARENTGSIDLASLGTTRIALLPWLMASSMSLTCCASSAEAGACWLTLILCSSPAFLSPLSSRSNQVALSFGIDTMV